MRLAHLTDIHLPIPAPPRFRDLTNKRVLGYLSWRRRRRFRHQIEPLGAIVADCHKMHPDFTAISGDLTNIALESEFSEGFQWLKNHFNGESAAFTPGNHDAYVETPWARGLGRLSQFMMGDRREENASRAPNDADDFPFTRRIGDCGLVFANSSPPTAPGLATGQLGETQINRIGAELTQLGEEKKCRILVLHHPVTEGATSGRKALVDRKGLRKTLYESGVDLILHGHTHRSIWATIETQNGVRPVVGGASASHPGAHGDYRPARYNLFSIGGDADNGWRITVDTREFDPASGDVRTAETRMLLPIA